VSGRARDALARTIELIANDIFGRGPGEDQTLEEAILDGLMSTTIRLSADSGNLSSYAGQTALVTLFGLVAMMGIGLNSISPRRVSWARSRPFTATNSAPRLCRTAMTLFQMLALVPTLDV
jgi:hypothetical protein